MVRECHHACIKQELYKKGRGRVALRARSCVVLQGWSPRSTLRKHGSIRSFQTPFNSRCGRRSHALALHQHGSLLAGAGVPSSTFEGGRYEMIVGFNVILLIPQPLVLWVDPWTFASLVACHSAAYQCHMDWRGGFRRQHLGTWPLQGLQFLAGQILGSLCELRAKS